MDLVTAKEKDDILKLLYKKGKITLLPNDKDSLIIKEYLYPLGYIEILGDREENGCNCIITEKGILFLKKGGYIKEARSRMKGLRLKAIKDNVLDRRIWISFLGGVIIGASICMAAEQKVNSKR